MPHAPLLLAVMALQKETNEALLRSAEAGHSAMRERVEYNEDCILRVKVRHWICWSPPTICLRPLASLLHSRQPKQKQHQVHSHFFVLGSVAATLTRANAEEMNSRSYPAWPLRAPATRILAITCSSYACRLRPLLGMRREMSRRTNGMILLNSTT
jgi:hypothetical protein